MTVTEVARELGVSPADVSLLFYRRYLPDDAAPVKNRRRDIPKSLVPRIKDELARRNKLPSSQAVGA